LACSGAAGSARFSLSLLLKPVSDPTFSEIIGRHLDQNLIARKHPDAVLAHSSRRMGDDLVFVLEFHPEGGVWEQFGDHSREFEHFFLRHKAPSASKFGGEWSGRPAKSRTIPVTRQLTWAVTQLRQRLTTQGHSGACLREAEAF
jgi:hypothetical protein